MEDKKIEKVDVCVRQKESKLGEKSKNEDNVCQLDTGQYNRHLLRVT